MKDNHSVFHPKFFSILKDYSFSSFLKDLSAGTIVGIVALPLAIAFAIASGVTPDRGLTTAIIAGFIISFFGGSRVQIGGPTGAFVVIVAGIINQYGLDGLLVCTMMAGVILIVLVLLRLGSIIKFIPYPLIVGFTTGIAVVIFSSQIKDFFGLQTPPLPADFIQKWKVYSAAIESTNFITLALSIGSLAILILWPKINNRIPASLIAIIVITALVHFFHLPVETIHSRFGDLPTGLPKPHLPTFSFEMIKSLISPAFTVAILGAIESLLSATVADSMIEGRHRSNTELIAQGIANTVVPLFGGIPATGAIARTATNVKNGGRTPIAGIVHSVTLFLIVLLFGRWAGMIPLCVMAAILIVIAYHMSEWRAFKSLLRSPRMDVAVLLSTFFLTILVDLTVAVEVGLVLSMVLFMKRMTDVTTIKEITLNQEINEETLREESDSITRKHIPQGVTIYELEGALFFGVASILKGTLGMGKTPPRVLILRMRHVLVLDATAMRSLKDLFDQCKRHQTQLILSGLHEQPLTAMKSAGFLEEIGHENATINIDLALHRANEVLNKKS